jgi:hypothetical protein
MTKSRLVVLSSSLVVVGGALAAVGAFILDPARAAVGPLPAEGLILPADARFVAGFDVKRLVASPFYQRYGKEKGGMGRPQAFAELEEKTGLDPERDVEQVVVAGGGGRGEKAGLVLVLGSFDRARLSRAIETEKKDKVTWKSVEGTTVYMFSEAEKGRGAGAAAFLDDRSLVLGSLDAVESAVTNRSRGTPALRSNAALMGLLERVKPGSTFWMVGDQSLLADLPKTVPAPGLPGADSGSATLNLPPLKSLVVTGDLDPLVALAITGEAADEAAARNLADVARGFIALASLQAGQKPELKQLASAFSVATEAARVQVNARIPYEVIDALQPPRAGVARAKPRS